MTYAKARAIKAAIFWTLALIASFVVIAGCSSTPPPVSPELECRAKLLKPFVTALAPDLVDAAREGKSLSEAVVKSLQESGVALEEVSILVSAWTRCAELGSGL